MFLSLLSFLSLQPECGLMLTRAEQEGVYRECSIQGPAQPPGQRLRSPCSLLAGRPGPAVAGHPRVFPGHASKGFAGLARLVMYADGSSHPICYLPPPT